MHNKYITLLFSIVTFVICGSFTPLKAEMNTFKIPYSLGGIDFEGTLVYNKNLNSKQPGLLMVPNWMGPTTESLEKAEKIAQMGYVVFMCDMYGVKIRPKDAGEASQAAGALYADRNLLRQRVSKALDVFLAQAAKLPLDTDNIGAIGFCFGGASVLELARTGEQRIKGVVSFHGNLKTPQAEDAKMIKVSVLVLHGADDPYVNQTEVTEFIAAMQQTKVDWQLVQFSQTVHSFTNPYANMAGKAAYNERSARHAFEMMNDFWRELFGK